MADHRVPQAKFCLMDGCSVRLGLLTEPPLCDKHMAEYKSYDPSSPNREGLYSEPKVVSLVRLWTVDKNRDERAGEAAHADARKHKNYGKGGW